MVWYEWAHETSAVQMQLKLGMPDSATFYDILESLRCRVAFHDNEHFDKLGGVGKIVECDEYEQGRKQKGTHGHETHVVGDIWGAWDRKSRKCYLEMYTKDSETDERRSGPPTQNEVQPLVRRVIETGSILFTDGAKAYVSPSDDYVSHFALRWRVCS